MDRELAAAVAECLCVVARCGGFVAAATWPVFPGAGLLPRSALAVGLAAVVMPGTFASAPRLPAVSPAGVVVEALLGLAMGTAVACLVAAAAWAFGMMSAACGLPGGDDADPECRETSGIGRLAWWVSVGGFMAAGGSRSVLGGLLDSFVAMPPGGVAMAAGGMDGWAGFLPLVSRLPGTAFTIAVSLAIPAVAAILAFHVVVAIATRVAGFEPGAGLVQAASALLLLVILAVTAEVWVVGFPRRIEAAIDRAFAVEEGL